MRDLRAAAEQAAARQTAAGEGAMERVAAQGGTVSFSHDDVAAMAVSTFSGLDVDREQIDAAMAVFKPVFEATAPQMAMVHEVAGVPTVHVVEASMLTGFEAGILVGLLAGLQDGES